MQTSIYKKAKQTRKKAIPFVLEKVEPAELGHTAGSAFVRSAQTHIKPANSWDEYVVKYGVRLERYR